MMKKVYILNIILIILLGILGFGRMGYQQEKVQYTRSIADKIIRFHVRANSDSGADQELKRKVRNGVGAFLQAKLAAVKSSRESEAVIKNNLNLIIDVAETVIEEEGFSYHVSAALTSVAFPRKTYGSFSFPEGEYEALQVVIGEGKGENWWCVMYPNLCFSDSTYEIVEEKAEKSLEKVLTAAEYAYLMRNKDYQIKFKWLSFFN